MSNKYYRQKKNRRPDQRRQYRQSLENAPISPTGESQDLTEYDSTDKAVRETENLTAQPIDTYPVGVAVQWTAGTIWKVSIGSLLFIGAIITIIVFFSNMNSKISVNETKIEAIEDKISKTEVQITQNKSEIIDYIDKQIRNFKEDFKNFFFRE